MLKKRKQQTEGRSAEEEKYQFMREQIRPQRKRIFMIFLRKAVGIVILAVIFGSIAGSTFIFMQNIMEDVNETQTRETALQGAMASEVTAGPDDNREDPLSRDSLKDYQAFWKEVAVVGKRCNRFLVKIRRRQSESGFHKSEEIGNAQSGVIFRESRRYYYILSTAGRWMETKSAEVEFSNGEAVPAKLMGMDGTLGIAVLVVAKGGISKEEKAQLQIAQFGRGQELEIGFPVIAIGSPNGVMNSVISGCIVNDNLTGEVIDGEVALYCSDIEYCEEGDGFVVDMRGDLVGIITNSYQSLTGKTGCAFMEAPAIRNVVSCLAQGKEMAYFGVTGCTYTGKKEPGRDGGEKGVYVSNVISRSPAYQGGLRVADVITGINGHEITNLQEMRERLLLYEAGTKIQVTVSRRSGNTQSERRLEVTLGAAR